MPGEFLAFTGNRGRLLKNGQIELLSDVAPYVWIDGMQVRVAEVESALRKVPFVADAAVLTRADLRMVNLRGAGFRDARLDEADLRGARLGGAFLIGASLRGANLRGAYVRLATFDGADLSGANLDEVIGLTQAQFDRTCWDNRTTPPKGVRGMRDDEG